MDALKAMWETVPPGTTEDLAGARHRLLDGMRAPRRVVTAPRALIAAAAATAAIALTSQVIGGASAYAVTKDPDGTLTVTLTELRDPEGLEAELAAAGVKADVTFLASGTRCQVPRFVGADESYGGPPVDSPDALREQANRTRSSKAIQWGSGTFQIFPEHVKRGETVVLEFSDERSAQVLWRMGSWLAEADSAVQPCTPVPHTG